MIVNFIGQIIASATEKKYGVTFGVSEPEMMADEESEVVVEETAAEETSVENPEVVVEETAAEETKEQKTKDPKTEDTSAEEAEVVVEETAIEESEVAVEKSKVEETKEQKTEEPKTEETSIEDSGVVAEETAAEETKEQKTEEHIAAKTIENIAKAACDPREGWLKGDNHPSDPIRPTKPKRAPEEDISINLPQGEKIEVLPTIETVPKEKVKIDLSPMKSKDTNTISKNNKDTLSDNLQYLQTIEEIANKNGLTVSINRQMYEDANIPTGMIEVRAFDKNNQFVPDKSFTIDTGVIIDRRQKLIPTLYQNGTPYEVFQFYELKSKAPNGMKGKVLDEILINTIFQKGLSGITKKPMYDKDTLALNSYVDLITLNSVTGLTSDTKNRIMERMRNMLQAGILGNISTDNPGLFRLAVKNVNTKDGSFVLTNQGTTYAFGYPSLCIVPYEVEFLPNGTCNLRKVGA